MKVYKIYIKNICIALLAVAMAACAKDEGSHEPKGTLLDMSVLFGTQGRLAELPNPDEMSQEKNGNGLKDVGVYIYYAEDYARGDLSKPYVRNMRFQVSDGQLVAANASGSDRFIYIYDRMTIVAFYPYNEDMNLEENHFNVLADEAKYPITRNDYSQQFYIPYRAQTQTDPTTAFFTVLNFQPKYTYKLEVVLVANGTGTFPASGDVQLLPDIDPNDDGVDSSLDGKRAAWYDNFEQKTNDGSGSDIQLYNAYIWTRQENRNDLKRGDVLLKSDKLTLIASQNLYPAEGRIYRYGYNMSTGEIFIPTSSNFVYDASSLAAVSGRAGSYFQVCDIDLSVNGDWTPISLVGKYDGGGHAINDMTINSTADDAEVGLFSRIQGNAVAANINLVNPKITASGDNIKVGALAGRLNVPMTPAEKQQLIGNLPPGLSPVVKDALIETILANAGNTQADIIASKVNNPEITVTGKDPMVGGLVGQAGAKNEDGNAKSRIWDTGVIGGSIEVNDGIPADNENAYVGGFVGLNQGYIGRSFVSTSDIDAQTQTGATPGGEPILSNKAKGLTNMGGQFTPAEGGLIDSSYANADDDNDAVKQLSIEWPSWGTYTGIWPIDPTGWMNAPSNSFWFSNGKQPDVYPSLQWERK